jgi:hypothetical protein
MNLAIWVLFCNVDSPRSGAVTTIQNPSQARNRRKDKSVVKDSVENTVLKVQPFRFILWTLEMRLEAMNG